MHSRSMYRRGGTSLLLLLVALCSGVLSAAFLLPHTTKEARRASVAMLSAPSATAAGKEAAVSTSPAVVVGKGRIGLALQEMLPSCVLVGRDDAIPSEGSAPIYVCTRNDDLRSVIEKTPVPQRQNLVFLQNGMLAPLLEEYGLQDTATQALIYFAVAKKGEAPTDGKTDLNPEGLTAAYGKWANALASTLTGAGLSCHVLDKEPFRAAMFEKLIWISAFMLVGAAHGGITVGEVESSHRDEVAALIRELASACTSVLGVSFEAGTEERLCAYTRSVAHFPTAVKEFQWRNGFFWDLSQQAAKAGKPDPCPLHTSLLKQVKAV